MWVKARLLVCCRKGDCVVNKEKYFDPETGELTNTPPAGADEHFNAVPAHRLDDLGAEVMDETPMSVPLRGRSHAFNQAELIRTLVTTEFSRLAGNSGHETFEEADDFDVGDYDHRSPYELDLNQELEGGDEDFVFEEFENVDTGQGVLESRPPRAPKNSSGASNGASKDKKGGTGRTKPKPSSEPGEASGDDDEGV